MTNTPSDAEIEKLAAEHLKAFSQFPMGGQVWLEGEVEFARAILAKWGTQPQAGAVPQRWKAVPVNPTPEMWKAAKSVPDPNPPYPPHYGLVWDAMLAASPTPPAEQQAASSAVLKAIREANMQLVRTGDDAFMLVPYKVATAEQAAPKAAPGDALDEAMRERDDAEDFIDALLDEVLGHERPEWSSSYGRADALNDVQERMTALHKPAVDKAWGQFQSAMAAPQQEAQEPVATLHCNDIGYVWARATEVGTRMRFEQPINLYTTPQPAPATQQAGDVVAYLDVGASGYLDLGAALSEDALQQLPKGRHALVIAGTYGIDGYVAAPQPSPMARAAEGVPAIQGEMNVQLDIDSNHSAPGQQRDMACSLALGQPVGNGSDQVAGHPSAQEDKLLTVAERNIRSFLRSAQFKGESDREAALNCVDVLWAAARAQADSVQEDAARYRWLREGNDAKHGAAWHVAVNLYGCEWDSAIDAAIAAQGGKV